MYLLQLQEFLGTKMVYERNIEINSVPDDNFEGVADKFIVA